MTDTGLETISRTRQNKQTQLYVMLAAITTMFLMSTFLFANWIFQLGLLIQKRYLQPEPWTKTDSDRTESVQTTLIRASYSMNLIFALDVSMRYSSPRLLYCC